MEPKILEIGSLVRVGTKFEMGDRVGEGRQVADEYTDRVMRVVAIHQSFDAPLSIDLAPADIINADESDTVVNIVRRRLTVL